jgi:hypothetical protein
MIALTASPGEKPHYHQRISNTRIVPMRVSPILLEILNPYARLPAKTAIAD